MDFERISIIGLGLMGGSFAMALKNKGFKGEIIGYDTSKSSMEVALEEKAIDYLATTPGQAVKGADLVVIAVPIGHYAAILKEICHFLPKNCIVTDVGSVKTEVVKMAKKFLPEDVEFIGGHPMTGSERSGFQAGNPFLYENAYYFITANENTKRHTVKKLEKIVKGIGAYPVILNEGEHDIIVSRISHLPHVIATILVNLMDKNKGISYLPFIGGGFRDTTRIASGNPQMWRDIFMMNKSEVLKNIKSFGMMLKEFQTLLEKEEEEPLMQYLENAKIIRDSIPKHGKNYISPMFELILSVEDKPGILADLTQLISSYNINIKEIEILHSRQEEQGALRLAFSSNEDREKAREILTEKGFTYVYPRN